MSGALIDEALNMLEPSKDETSKDETKSANSPRAPRPEKPPIVKQQGAVRRRTVKNRKYDWDAIRDYYIHGIEDEDGNYSFPTLKDTAINFEMHETRVRDRAAAERWTDQRAVFQRRVQVERQKERAKHLVGEAVQLDSTALGTAKLGVQLVYGRLGEIGRDFTKHQTKRAELETLAASGAPVDPRQLLSPVYYREMNELASAAERFYDIGRKALGEDISRIEVSGPDGVPIEHNVQVSLELARDDPERLAKLMHAAAVTGLFSELGIDGTEDVFFEDAEVVDETPALEAGSNGHAPTPTDTGGSEAGTGGPRPPASGPSPNGHATENGRHDSG